MQQAYPGGSKIVWEAFKLKGIPEEVIGTYMQSSSSNRLKQYESVFKQWWQYCSEHGISVFSASTSELLQFFQKILDTTRWSYGTLNSYGAAMALIPPEKTGKNFQLRRFFSGVSKCRPSRPKYIILLGIQR